MYKPSPSHQLILDTLTEKNRKGFAIGGGAFYGKNLGTREGFSSYKKNLVTENFFKYSSAGGGSSFEDLTPEQKKLFKKGELYYARMEDPSRPRTATKKPMRTIFGDSDKIDIIVGNKIPTDLKNLPKELSARGKTAKKIFSN